MTTLKGNVQSVLPAATIVGVAPGSTQFVGSQLDTTTNVRRYILRPTLGSLIADNITPVGVVSVVTTATPTPPTILPIFGPGGSIVGYNVTNGGAGNADALIENLGYLASNAELEAAALSARGNRAAAELQTRRASIYRDAQAEAMR
jgi:hypothetical protein